MRISHYITIIVAAALIAALFFFANTKPPKEDIAQTATQSNEHDGHDHETEFLIEPFLDSVRADLPKHAAKELQTLETGLEKASEIAKANMYKDMAELWLQHKNAPAAAHFYNQWAKLDNSEKSLNFAGRFNLDLFHNVKQADIQGWAAQQAINLFEKSLELNKDNDTVKMALASCYIDGTPQPMQGIQLLLGIVREKPNNVPANLMLGQLSIRSGQMDKAKDRFEKVLKIEPNNTEALYFLAEVYKSKGDKQKAIELLERCKEIINSPAFDKEIDNYIKSFK